MKKISILIPITISLIILGCNNYMHPTDSKNQIKTPLIQFYAQVKEGGDGGNPEVKLMHDCLKLKNRLYAQCLNKLFPNEPNVLVSAKQGKPILLAGRGTKIERDQINLENHDLYLLYVDISNIKLPVTSNILNTKISRDTNSMLFLIPVKEIKKEIILKDKDGDIVLQYKITNE